LLDVRTARRRVAAVFVAVLAAATAERADADDPPTGSATLRLSADSPVLSPGERQVAVRVDGCDERPALSANVGTVRRVRAAGPRRDVAEYAPPPEARPLVAIVTAVCGDRWGWTAIPVVGRGVATAHTRPGAAIHVTIGERSYGPAVADGEGAVRVAVDVPPGVRFAYHGARPLDLGVPPAPHAHVVAGPIVVRADREETVRVLAFAVTDAGAPRAGAPLALSASAGVVGSAVEIEPGVALARWTLPPGRAGRVRLEARLADDDGPPAAVEVERRPGPPARVEAFPDRAQAVAGEAPLQLDVAVTDAAGNPAPEEPRVEPKDLVLERRGVGPGLWAVGLAVPERLAGRSELSVSIAAGGAAGAARVPLLAAPAATLAVEPAGREVVAGGREAFSLRVALRDRFGNASPDVPEVETDGPADVETVRDGESFVVTVRPRRGLGRRYDAVTIHGAGRSERIPLAVRGADPRLALSGRAGFLASTGGGRSAYLGGETALWPSARLGAALEAGAFAFGRRERVPLPGRSAELRSDVRYLPVVASLRWRAEPTPDTLVVVGAGAALAPLSAEVRLEGEPPVRESGLAAGGLLSLGAGRHLGSGTLLVEARALWLADPGLHAVRGRVLAGGLALGWSHAVL
jgi:hypothetical protein